MLELRQAATRWYRAPELLFSARVYGAEVASLHHALLASGCSEVQGALRLPLNMSPMLQKVSRGSS
jgi:hypothetical protein